MSVKGFKFDGTDVIQKYDFNELENKPTADATLSVSGAFADAQATGNALSGQKTLLTNDIRNAGGVLTNGKLTGWAKATYAVRTGERFSSTKQITNDTAVGVPTGVTRFTTDGVLTAYVLAWDLSGNYIGFYNSNHVFSTEGANYALWSDFDCTAYPNYVFRFVCQFTPQSTGITAADGDRVHFQATDTTLSVADRPADGKAVGDYIFDQYSQEAYHTIVASELESGYWAFSTKSANTKRLRGARLYPVRKGQKIRYSNPTMKVYFGVLATKTSGSYQQVSGWITAGETDAWYYINYDGYLVVNIDSPNDISVSDYDSTIVLVNEVVYNAEIDSLRSDLFKVFKRVGVCGDSISVGYIQDRSATTSRNLAYSWPKAVMQDAGGTPWLNFGTSGQTTLTWASNATYGKVQLEAANNKCQAYVICLGANDEWNSVSLGSTSDIVDNPDTAATTYYGGYNRIIQIIKRKNPDAKIFCVTMPLATESKGYADAVRYIATEHYGTENNVFLVDLAKDYRQYFTAEDIGIYTDKMNSDTVNHGHYSPYGYRMIANVMERAINEAMAKNQLGFMDIADIAYDTATPTANTMTE